MELNVGWRLLVGAVIAYYGTLIFYRLLLHPLARFPGPKLAAVSRWYEAYYDVYLDGQYTSKIAALHKQYGPIIRISPYELHVIDPSFFDTLYRMNGQWHKYDWTYDAFGTTSSTIFCSDHDVHKRRRRAIAPFFSKQSIIARHDVLLRNIDKLCQRISKHAGTSLNLGAALSAFTRDTANEVVVGRRYNEIDQDDFGLGLSIASQGAGILWRTTKHVRWFGPTLKAMPIPWAMKVADKETRSFLQFLQQSEQDTRDTLAAAQSSPPTDKNYETMVHAIVHSDLPPSEKTFDRVFEDVAMVTGAAFETTASALRLICYHVYANPTILGQLRRELASVATTTSEPISLKKLEQLPYLTAVLTEGMRLSPGTASRAARITNVDLLYSDWRIPAGTPVGMTAYLMHIDETLYPDPMVFNPERWMNGTLGVASTSKYAPFSRGTRMCLGMHMARAEMYMLLAGLVQQFTFTIEDATASDFEFENDKFVIGTKAGCNLNVGVTPYAGLISSHLANH